MLIVESINLFLYICSRIDIAIMKIEQEELEKQVIERMSLNLVFVPSALYAYLLGHNTIVQRR